MEASGQKNALQMTETKEARKLLHIALEDLPEEQRETFSLKVLENLTFDEISKAMDCSLNTTKSRMRYAVQTLREIFMKRGYFAT
jgi:RNA polymerase sigma-70 factor (ECF subfamily)